MLSAVTCIFQKDRFLAPALFGAAALLWIFLAIAQLPQDLGSLEPKGRINPDGSEVWGFPEGSGLEEVIEVHVKDGRVVREVLRPSSHFAADALGDS